MWAGATHTLHALCVPRPHRVQHQIESNFRLHFNYIRPKKENTRTMAPLLCLIYLPERFDTAMHNENRRMHWTMRQKWIQISV